MDFAFSEEQDQLRAAARAYLADRYTVERVAALADSEHGWDPGSWDEIARMGWLDDELGALEHAVLAEETGYALYPGPFLTTVALARPAYGTAAPTRPATLAWLDNGGHRLRDLGSTRCLAERAGDGWQLSGTKRGVPDAAACDEAVVAALGPYGVALWRLDLTTHGDVVRPLSTMDSTRRVAEFRLDGTPAEPLVADSAAGQVLCDIRRAALALFACEAVGVAQRALDIATGHVSVREQFDRPIGAYQGVSHRLANVYTAVQLARSLAYRAAWCVSEADLTVDEACATARISAGQAAVFACENAIQAMGGIGFTWDHPLHRFYKRAQWLNTFDGVPRAHRAELAALLLDSPN